MRLIVQTMRVKGKKGEGKHEHNKRSGSYKKTQIKLLKMKDTVAEMRLH